MNPSSAQHLGSTRSARHRTHLLQTPDTFVRAPLPGMQNATAIVHASPALGAGFTQYTVEMSPEGLVPPAASQRFLYVMEGAIEVALHDRRESLVSGDYAYLPEGAAHAVTSLEPSRLAVIEKKYREYASCPKPEPIFRAEADLPSVPLMGDHDLQVKSLLPDHPSFDFAVNTMTYQPGASLAMTEIHVMEHGLLMLEGGGIYRLGEHWHSAVAGDFIWMAPYCPQWFGAIGKVPARYLIYKNWNRHPQEHS